MQAINMSLSKVNVSEAAKPIKPYKHERILPLLISPLSAPRPPRNCILILTLRPHHNSSAHSLKTLGQGLGQGWGAEGDMARAVRGSNKMTLVFKRFINAAVVGTATLKNVDCCVRSKSWNNWIKSGVLDRCPSHGHLFHKALNLTPSAHLNDFQGCPLLSSFHVCFTPNLVWNSKYLALHSRCFRWPEIRRRWRFITLCFMNVSLFKWAWYEIFKSRTCGRWVESARHSNYPCYQLHARPVKHDIKKRGKKKILKGIGLEAWMLFMRTCYG